MWSWYAHSGYIKHRSGRPVIASKVRSFDSLVRCFKISPGMRRIADSCSGSSLVYTDQSHPSTISHPSIHPPIHPVYTYIYPPIYCYYPCTAPPLPRTVPPRRYRRRNTPVVCALCTDILLNEVT